VAPRADRPLLPHGRAAGGQTRAGVAC
jgi:hypothetical protein